MTKEEAIGWFKGTFGARIARAVEGTPFTPDLIAAVAYQETGYIWSPLVQEGFAPEQILRLCVGDTLDEDRGRSCFPRNKAELMRAPRGAEMFAIARQALLDMAQHTRGYENATINPNKFCHGYGIFQYDLQFFQENPAYFLEQKWADFDACLEQFLVELKQAAGRQRWAGKSSLTHDEQVYVAIAYNKGTADCNRGFKQGHKCDGRCYGENIDEFLCLAAKMPDPAPEVRFAAERPAYEVDVVEGPLRLRSAPLIPKDNEIGNVLVGLPKGHVVQRLSPGTKRGFMEVEAIVDGKLYTGYSAVRYLRAIKRAKPAGKKAAAGKPPQQEEEKVAALAATPGEIMDIEQMIRAVRKSLNLAVDGKAGPATWKAIYAKITGKNPEPPPSKAAATRPPAAGSAVDPRSEKNIATLQPEVRPYARALVQKAASMGITIKVISALRSYAEQNDLYAQGRTKPGKIVTNARGGYSNHNFGIAFDIGVFDGSSYVPESPRYKAVGALGVELGLEWGGNWKTIKDEPHFQLRPPWAGTRPESEMLAELRNRNGSGKGLYA